MTPEIRRAALRMAAKTAMVMTLGCRGTDGARPNPAAPHPAANPYVSAPLPCDQFLAGLAAGEYDALAQDDPLRRDRFSGVGVYRAFLDIAARHSPRTHECCTAALQGG